MSERKAPAADDSAAIQRTADRLIKQVGDLQLTYGKLSALAVYEPSWSCWVALPTEGRVGKGYNWGVYGNLCYYVWPQTIADGVNPVSVFDSICQSLTSLLWRLSPRLPDNFEFWKRGVPGDAMSHWVWFVAGFAVLELPNRSPITRRKCWGKDGATYDADYLETLRSFQPEKQREQMPPNADCWFVEIVEFLQTTIDAVEYLAALPPVLENSTNDTATIGETVADNEPRTVPELTIPQCADVAPVERTFAHLFFEVSCAETEDAIADDKDAKGHWRGAHQLRRHSERRRADYPKWPGVDRLRLEIESAGDTFNRAGLIKWRARHCLAVGFDTDTLNATKLVDIAEKLANRLVEPITPRGETTGTETNPEMGSGTENENTLQKVLGAFTKGASVKAFAQVASVIESDKTVEQKVDEMNKLLPLGGLSAPAIASLLGCTKQAVMKTSYWKKKRKGTDAERVEVSRTRMTELGKRYELEREDE